MIRQTVKWSELYPHERAVLQFFLNRSDERHPQVVCTTGVIAHTVNLLECDVEYTLARLGDYGIVRNALKHPKGDLGYWRVNYDRLPPMERPMPSIT
jgi:hypothetical protein